MQLIKRDIRHLVETLEIIILIFLNITKYKVVSYAEKFFIVGFHESIYLNSFFLD